MQLNKVIANNYNCEGSDIHVHWAKHKILFHCDNQAVVDIWKKGSSKDPNIMALVRMLYFRAAQHNINICVMHIPGVHNNVADAISRFQMVRF